MSSEFNIKAFPGLKAVLKRPQSTKAEVRKAAPPAKKPMIVDAHNQGLVEKGVSRAMDAKEAEIRKDDEAPKDLHEYNRRHVVVSNTHLKEQKISVVIGIDFGTSFTKAYFTSSKGNAVPVEWHEVLQGTEGTSDDDYFLPTRLFFDPATHGLYFKQYTAGAEVKYFKYGMIKPELRNPEFEGIWAIDANGVSKAEFYASVFYMANVIGLVKRYVLKKLKVNESRVTFRINMGCPIDNWSDRYKNLYGLVLLFANMLQVSILREGMTLQEIFTFCKIRENAVPDSHLQVVPELYAEGFSFINDKQTADGIYVILDVGGGTVDFAVILLQHENSIKKVKFLSQSVVPLGVEMLLNKFYPNIPFEERKQKREVLVKEKPVFQKVMVGEWQNLKVVQERAPYEFRDGFHSRIMEARENLRTRTKCERLMDDVYKNKEAIRMFTYGGGAYYEWYHSIIREHNSALNAAGIPNLLNVHKKSNLFRLVIAENLAKIRGTVSVDSPDDAIDFNLCFNKQEVKKAFGGIDLAEYGLLDDR